MSDGVNDYDVVNMKKVKELETEINKLKKKKNYSIIEMKWWGKLTQFKFNHMKSYFTPSGARGGAGISYSSK